MGCFSGRLMASASDQKLFCKLFSPFCCSFDEFVEEKVISPSYSSAILTPPEEGFLISPWYSLELCTEMGIFFLFSFTLSLFFSQIFVRPPQTTILPFHISFSQGWFWSLSPVQCHEPLSIVLQAFCLSDIIPLIYLLLLLYNHKGFDSGWFRLYMNGLVVFPTFFNLSVIFAIRSSWSEPQSTPGLVFSHCIELLAASLAAKNIINLISVLTIWWCPCVESSLVLLEEGVCYDQCILLSKLC